MVALVVVFGLVLAAAPVVLAHDQTAIITIRSNGTIGTPGSWECSTQFEVDFTRVFCLPPEQPDGQQSTCGEKDVSVRVTGRAATTGNLAGTAWCTGGGGANAECQVNTSGPAPQSCSATVPAQPFLLFLNQVACQATHSGVDARWMVRCRVTVGHTEGSQSPLISLIADESLDRWTVLDHSEGLNWNELAVAFSNTTVYCALNNTADASSPCELSFGNFVTIAGGEFGFALVKVDDFLDFCALEGTPAAVFPGILTLRHNPTGVILFEHTFESIHVCS